MNFDINILLFIQDYIRNDFLTSFFKFMTFLGDQGKIWIFILLLLLIQKDTRKLAFKAILSIIAVTIFMEIIKHIVTRPRPFITHPQLISLIKPGGYSFPSGHTGSSFVIAFVCFKQLPKKYSIPIFIIACLIACSRLYLGVHYPTDILGGILLAYLTSKIPFEKLLDKLPKKDAVA